MLQKESGKINQIYENIFMEIRYSKFVKILLSSFKMKNGYKLFFLGKTVELRKANLAFLEILVEKFKKNLINLLLFYIIKRNEIVFDVC